MVRIICVMQRRASLSCSDKGFAGLQTMILDSAVCEVVRSGARLVARHILAP